MNDLQEETPSPRQSVVLGAPLFRLLAINLAAGVSVAVLLVGGLLLLNPGHLRDLILADDTPGVALGLLLFGFIVTLGSSAMGTAIMAMGQQQIDGGPRRGRGQLVAQSVAAMAPTQGKAASGS
ncbi:MULTISPECIES: hypothetical protein [Bradyrhizobium]|uniref:hypothetical protein n=1 Tax=Bradyrhizobium elkanii TaxID=29448 RepID=UPI000425D2F7|nr:hypothetical protein [Bradyrhizobium elkanii]